jgi:cytochrome d ubiquinol oxidase subunit II
MFLDYETLRVIWWLILGLTVVGFAIMHGFGLGVAMLLPFIARTEVERLNALGTMDVAWDGNQAWFLLAGVAIFATWPPLQAIAFSGFFFAMFAVLLGLIIRPVASALRPRASGAAERAAWDGVIFLSGFVPAALLGVAVGNVLQGVPFHFDVLRQPIYDGAFLDLFNMFGLLNGAVAVAMLCMHGGAYLALQTDGMVAERARVAASAAAMTLILLFAISGLWAGLGIGGYAVVDGGSANAPSDPLAKTVAVVPDGWFRNYVSRLAAVFASGCGLIAPLGVVLFLDIRLKTYAFVASCVGVFGVVAACGLTMFPFLLPSSIDPNSSLTVWDASAPPSTLSNLLIASAVLMPVVIGYTVWAFRRLRRDGA